MEVTCESHTSAHAQIGARVACLPNHGRIGSAGSARHATARQPSAAGFLQRSIAHRSTRLPPASLGASACEGAPTLHQNITFDPEFRFGSAARPSLSPRQTELTRGSTGKLHRAFRRGPRTRCFFVGGHFNRKLCEHLARHPAHAPSAHEPAHRPHTHPHRYAPGTCGLGTPWRPRHTRPYIHGTPSLGHAPADAPSASSQLSPFGQRSSIVKQAIC